MTHETLKKEWDEVKLQHWSSRLSKFIPIPQSLRDYIFGYWIMGVEQARKERTEEIVGMLKEEMDSLALKNITQNLQEFERYYLQGSIGSLAGVINKLTKENL